MGQRFSAKPLNKRMPDEALIRFFSTIQPCRLVCRDQGAQKKRRSVFFNHAKVFLYSADGSEDFGARTREAQSRGELSS
jgi:hypothetical protein